MEQFYFTVNLELLLWAASFVSLFVFSLLFLTYRHRSQFTGDNLPPGNVGYPLIGESYEFKSGGWKGHPESFILGRIKKYSSEVFKSSIFGDRVIFFCGAACNKLIFTKETKLVTVAWISSIAKIFPSIMESSSSAESMNLRKMFPIFMKPQSLHGHIGVMDIIAQKHFAENWVNNKEVHVFPLTKTYTFTLAARLFVSLEDPKDIEKLSTPFDLVNTGIISMPIDLPGTPFNKAIKASNSIRDELHKIIKQRKIDLAEGKASTTQDILSHMLMVCDDNGMHLKELDIADKILGLLIAGYETASGACTFIVKYLGELPHIYDVVYKEQMEIANSKAPGELLNWDDIQKMKYSWNVAQEVLRMVPPLQGAFRVALTDFTFNGFKIPKGWKLYWSPNSTHKNSTYFPEPEKFDPSRFEGTGPAPYTFVPFGGGSRGCPGKDYARLEILVFMHNLVKRFKWENIILDEKMIVDPMPTPAKGLPVRLFPHRSV